MSEQKEKHEKLINDIFGGDDSELEEEIVEENIPIDFESDDEKEVLPLPSFKKAGNRRPASKPAKRQRQEVEPEEDLTPEQQKLKEAERDINGILQKLKPLKPRKSDLETEVEIDEIIAALLESMRNAANNDQEFNRNGMPAIAKLKLLPSVKPQLLKMHWVPQLLDANVLECIRFWLEPLGDGSLPSLDIQKVMFEAISQVILANQYPVETHHLRASMIGRVVMFYTKSERVTQPIKRIAEELVAKWMRPILGKSADHRHKKILAARYETIKSKVMGSQNESQPSEFERPNRALIPSKIAPAFEVMPQSKVSVPAGGEKRIDKYRKLKSIMQKISRN